MTSMGLSIFDVCPDLLKFDEKVNVIFGIESVLKLSLYPIHVFLHWASEVNFTCQCYWSLKIPPPFYTRPDHVVYLLVSSDTVPPGLLGM